MEIRRIRSRHFHFCHLRPRQRELRCSIRWMWPGRWPCGLTETLFRPEDPIPNCSRISTTFMIRITECTLRPPKDPSWKERWNCPEKSTRKSWINFCCRKSTFNEWEVTIKKLTGGKTTTIRGKTTTAIKTSIWSCHCPKSTCCKTPTNFYLRTEPNSFSRESNNNSKTKIGKFRFRRSPDSLLPNFRSFEGGTVKNSQPFMKRGRKWYFFCTIKRCFQKCYL